MQRSVRRSLRLALGAAFGLVAVGLAYSFLVDGFIFETHRSEIANLIESADPADRDLTQQVHELLLLSLSSPTAPYSTRLLIRKFDA